MVTPSPPATFGKATGYTGNTKGQTMTNTGKVRRLDRFRHAGHAWIIDGRLEEFRRVDNPHERVPFDSERGQDMYHAALYGALTRAVCDLYGSGR